MLSDSRSIQQHNSIWRGQPRERFMDLVEDKRVSMRYTIMVLITLTAFGLLLVGEGAVDIQHVMQDNLSPTMKPPETDVILTSSMAAFLNDSWTPGYFVPDVYTALAMNKQGILANSSNEIYSFMNDSWIPPSAMAPIYTALAAGKDNTVAWSGESIYQFLQNGWTPSTPVLEYQTGVGYTRHQMS
jgi:hypothetical protein